MLSSEARTFEVTEFFPYQMSRTRAGEESGRDGRNPKYYIGSGIFLKWISNASAKRTCGKGWVADHVT